MKNTTRSLVRTAMFCAIALVLSLVERLLEPLFAFMPGVKLGIANIAVLMALVLDGAVSGITVVVIKCLFSAIFSANVTSLIFSLSASLTSFALQLLILKLGKNKIGIIAVSVIGALVHNVTQVLVASLLVQTNLTVLTIFLLPAGFVAGVFTGLVSYYAIKGMPEKFLN